jgi:hypothetical protein
MFRKHMSSLYLPTVAAMLLAQLFIGNASAAGSGRVGSPVLHLSSVNAKQVSMLARSNIKSIKQLSRTSVSRVARVLRINRVAATKIVKEARRESSRFGQLYVKAKQKYPIKKLRRAAQLRIVNAYASLIAPTNECTLLVRKVCGMENQCANSPGCPPAKQLLERFNQSTDHAEAAESCLISLEDAVIFHECMQ